MLKRSEASKKLRNCHPNCRGGVGPPKKRREITKQQDLSCWNEVNQRSTPEGAKVKHLKNHETVIQVVGAVPTCPPKKPQGISRNTKEEIPHTRFGITKL